MDTITDVTFNITALFGLLILIALAAFSFLEVLDNKGVNIPFFSESRRRKELARIEHIYQQDHELLFTFEQRRIETLLHQLGLRQDQFAKVRLEIARLSALPSLEPEAAKEAIMEICLSDMVFIDQTKMPEKLYTEVDYYLNFVDIMFEENMARHISRIMAAFIDRILKAQWPSVTRYTVIVPTQGNFLLGYNVAKVLQRPFVKMRNKERMHKDKYWDGELHPDDKVLLLHDVTVTAYQLLESINLCPNTVDVLGVFTLVYRKEWNAKNVLQRGGYQIFSIFETEDTWLAKERLKRKVNEKKL